MAKTHWNHRVVEINEPNNHRWELHEVYYKNDKPEMRTQHPIDFVSWESPKELEAEMRRAFEAFKKPVLRDEEIG